ncbi:uncharacterized protein FPRO_16135 [Fusarium proliferatum ET1]|uniref:Uncharacterized protein n=1 Tax=Fusarium proliferatum (strain ET1) TaxID=1227346 RepID=A0A1L7WBD7_FUSPR|nr:uncharacterized protein FPRO_16135 [Fusarium proliferatum ET1]CZR49930.1 uncharacterized protein FPRO_16135 [Fusarium proliferatum ET1]
MDEFRSLLSCPSTTTTTISFSSASLAYDTKTPTSRRSTPYEVCKTDYNGPHTSVSYPGAELTPPSSAMGPVKPEPEHNSILDSLPNTPMKREQPGFEYEHKMDMNMARRGSIGLSIPSNSFGMYSYSPDASMGPASLMTTPPQSISGSEAA